MFSCFKLREVEIKVRDVNQECHAGFELEESLTLNDFCPKGLCPVLFYYLLPYIDAIFNEARFSYGKENTISVQCPHPDIGATAKITRKGKTVIIEIIRMKQQCEYYDFKKASKWEIDKNDKRRCRQAFYGIMSQIFGLKNMSIFTCSRYPAYVTFELKAKMI